MESPTTICFNCEKILPERAKFCNACLTQVRCKVCETSLEKDALGCFECGTPIIQSTNFQHKNSQFNTISISETATDRKIEATFSDNIGKELTGLLREAVLLRKTDISSQKLPLLKENTTEDTGFEELKNSKIESSNAPNGTTQEAQDSDKENTRPMTLPSSHPALIAIAMKALPSTETEWVLVYSYYASNFGKDIFSRQDIIAKYDESKRRTTDRMNALTTNIKNSVRAGRINALEGGYSMLDLGISQAKEVISRTKGTVIQSKSKKAKDVTDSGESDSPKDKLKKNNKSITRSKRLNDINFHPDKKDNLPTYIQKFKIKNDSERILLFVNYLKDIVNVNNVTYDHVYTCFEELNLNTPPNVPQATRNCASVHGYIDVTNSKDIMVTTNGKNKIRNWNKNV